MYDVHIKADEMALVGHQSKNNHEDTVYVMVTRLLGYSIYISLLQCRVVPIYFNYLNISMFLM